MSETRSGTEALMMSKVASLPELGTTMAGTGLHPLPDFRASLQQLFEPFGRLVETGGAKMLDRLFDVLQAFWIGFA